MSIELVIFIILAAVAIFSAALMLVTRNAVHSALFLVTNFLCVSFFYLMLNAPFLAMIQVTVYAGAIMVLFMFVIMLLGSERLNEGGGRYAWIAPVAVVLTMIFLFVAFGAVVQGKISLLKPVAHDPQVRFVDVVAGAPAFDVYVGNQKIAGNVGYNAATDFVATPAGDAQALLFPTCTQSQCADPLTSNAAPVLALPLKLAGDTQTTYVIAGTPDQLQLITVPTDLSTVDQDQDIRVTAVNALPGSQAITLMRRDPAIVASSDLKAPKPLTPLFDPLKFGEVS